MDATFKRLGRRGLPLGFASLFLAAVGCGGTGEVSGKVTYEGQVVTGGNVVFVPESGPSASATIDPEDGSYKIQKIPAGKVMVAVVSARAEGGGGPFGPPEGAMNGPPPGVTLPPGVKYGAGTSKAKYMAELDPYNDPNKSGITHMVTAGSQTWNIELPPK
jgi:hypothetical protein